MSDTPHYVSALDVEEWATKCINLERERDEARSLETMYQKVIAACLCCDPIPACQREDDQLEPPWEVIDRIRRERDEALEKIKQQKLEIVRLNGATNHAGGTPLKIALRERDEARKEAEYYKERYEQLKDSMKMNNNPTPETDALDSKWDSYSRPFEAIDLARKLEQERDQMKQAWYEMHSSFERSRDEVEKLIHERDEVRKESEYYKERYEQLKEGGNERTPEIPKWYNCREIPGRHQGGREMSDRPTPETDKNVEDIGMGCQMVNADFARKLEQERNEAMDVLSNLSHYLSCGLGDENTTPQDYGARIREGINALTDPIVKEKEKLRKMLDLQTKIVVDLEMRLMK